MTVQGLVNRLNELMAHGLNPGAIVKAFDADSDQMQAVTGLLYDHNEVEICTDDMGG